jgi:acetyl esterase
VCTGCLGTGLEWVKSSGRGTIYSYSVVHRPQRSEFEAPYVVAIIELEEGWHMLSNIVGCDVDGVRIGMPVEVVFQKMSEEITLPYFKPRRILDAQLAALLEADKDAPRMEDQEPAAARQIYEEMVRQLGEQRLEVAKVEDRRVPGPDGDIPIRIYWPTGATGAPPVLAYLHGGGWVLGSLDSYDAVARRIAHGGHCIVVSVDYRLAPEHKFPAAVEDALAAFSWTVANAANIGGDAKRVAIGGDSAGGNLAAVVSQIAASKGGPKPCLQLLLYPVLQQESSTDSYGECAEGYLLTRRLMAWFMEHYRQTKADMTDLRASPLLAESHAGLPPTLIACAGFDVLRDEGIAYARKLREAGVPVRCREFDGLIHGYFSMGAVSEAARNAVEISLADLREAFAGLR